MSMMQNSVLPAKHTLPHLTITCLLVITSCFPLALSAGENTRNNEPRVYNTVRITTAKPKIDGLLNDACWLEGEWSGNYRQWMPAEGAEPSQKTEIKILYDNENIYVAIRCYDNEPDKTDRQMARRDEFSGDIVGINFDSYHDHRTGFEFNLTAAGSKIDLILTNEGWDVNWNPVWDGKVGQEDSAWVAEMQIPLSQLRYDNQPVQVWGMHSWRWLNRNKEEDQWNLMPRDNAGPLFHFGEIHGLENLPRVSRVEFLPYGVAKIKTYEAEKGNPFADGSDPSLNVGLDGKFGVGSNFTVDYTINPDFGQVEADPSELNLTAFETYYDEKRPFFIEGRNIFNFGFDDFQLLYSRRIGHTPSYDPEVSDGEYTRKPDNTSILGAMKLTGKTGKGLSIGIMESLTSREYTEISTAGDDYRVVSEPLTNYFAGRIQQDINKSNTTIGGMITSTYRNLDKDYLKFLNQSALTGGIDFRHYLQNKTYYIDFKAIGSQITGSTRAITELQKQSSRYYQRPDASYLDYDTTATSLSGTAGTLEFRKAANGKWRFGIGAHWSSPGIELNDMGFQTNADHIMQGQTIGYVESKPHGIFRSYNIEFSEINHWNFGKEFLFSEFELEADLVFKNKWELYSNIDLNTNPLDTRLLRGGPGVHSYGETSQDYFLFTDGSKKLSFGLGYENELKFKKTAAEHEWHSELNWKVTNSLQLSPEFTFSKSRDEFHYVSAGDYNDRGRYLVGNLDRKTYEMTLRVSYAITPELTIQYYGSPYLTMGNYTEFKTLADASATDPGKVFRTFDNSEIAYDPDTREYTIDVASDPEGPYTLSNPDFNFRQFRSNLVARWEYRPGSSLYLVWTHSRTSSEDVTNHSFDYNMENLFSEHAENIFLVKFSYWFSL